MTSQSRLAAGILLVILPTVIFGGVSILSLLIRPNSGYMNNPLRQNLWRAGHAHAGVFLVVGLVAGRYVDGAALSSGAKQFVRWGIGSAAICLPVAFFLSV